MTHKVLTYLIGGVIGLIAICGTIGIIMDHKTNKAPSTPIIITPTVIPVVAKVVPIPVVPAIPATTAPVSATNFNVGTPAYDYTTLTRGKVVNLYSGQKLVVIGVGVFELWLEQSSNRKIVSITSFNRGVQGSTSSFVIVYTE